MQIRKPRIGRNQLNGNKLNVMLLLVAKSEYEKFNDDYGCGDHVYFSLDMAADLIFRMKPEHYAKYPKQVESLHEDLVKTANEIFDECLSKDVDSVSRGITIWQMSGWFDDEDKLDKTFNLELLVQV